MLVFDDLSRDEIQLKRRSDLHFDGLIPNRAGKCPIDHCQVFVYHFQLMHFLPTSFMNVSKHISYHFRPFYIFSDIIQSFVFLSSLKRPHWVLFMSEIRLWCKMKALCKEHLRQNVKVSIFQVVGCPLQKL